MRKPTARRPTPPKRPPPDQQEVVHPSGKITHVETQWAGPLPPPAILDGFNHVAENGAERIFKQWETESEHRRMMERRDFTWSVAEGRRCSTRQTSRWHSAEHRTYSPASTKRPA
ncbi:DUF2335 domain-containing protein [Devosia neptuniae]|uniref:DUF2335 domain-containing protein n=1 Tax=Devosia neptuniae TaxID=191302 RepID=UPI0036F416D8